MSLPKRIIHGFFIFATLMNFAVAPAHAVDYTSNSTFWSWIAGKGGVAQAIVGNITGDAACPESADGKHHASSYEVEGTNGRYKCICSECGETFTAYTSDLSTAYDSYVSDLPLTGVDSSGHFLWYVTYSDIELKRDGYNPGINYYDYSSVLNCIPYSYPNMSRSVYPEYQLSINSSEHSWAVVVMNKDSNKYTGVGFYNTFFTVPVTGTYTLLGTPVLEGVCSKLDGSKVSFVKSYESKRLGSCTIGGRLTPWFPNAYNARSQGSEFWAVEDCLYFTGTFSLPVFEVEVIPSSSELSTYNYTIDSRPSSITGDYGILGDDNTLTKIDSQTIVNETDNSVYNPVTNTTSTISSWDYDYSSRKYNLTLDTGDKMTVTYGDENITIQEGDTVYNVYYLVETGDDGGGDVPADHVHDYTSTVTREPTCTTAGVKTYTCTAGDSTYTESIPSLGHDWVIKEQIPTEYDENGDIVTQGYTIYRCTRCGEEYKSTDGTVPDSGGGAGKETIWQKIGKLFGTIGNGLLSIIEAAISKLLDGLISLAEMIGEKLTALVEMILGWFDSIPQMFTGFLSFLSAIFPFIPEEAMLLLTFGLAAVVFIAIIKAIRR